MIALATALAMAAPVVAADLSPARWPEREQLEALERSPSPPAARVLNGRRELVSATMSPIAVHAGMEALRQGGTAADAAVAVALTQVATDLGAVISYAGVVQAVYFEARTGRVYALDGGWGSYREETSPRTIPKSDISLVVPAAGAPPLPADVGRMTLTPGFMAGMAALNGRFGRLPLADLLAPSIWYAREGVPVNGRLASYFAIRRPVFSRTDAGRRFLGGAGGELPVAGRRFRNPDLAATLEAVAKDGPAAMQSGPWARGFIAAVRAAGGKASEADFAGYTARWGEPLHTGFDGAMVYAPDGAGGCAVLAAFNLLDAQDPARLGPSWRDAASFRAHDLAARFASYGGYLPKVRAVEQAEGLGSTCQARLTPAYAQAMAPRMAELLAGGPTLEPGHHSAAVVVVDRFGNVAALVHSGNSVIWGDTGLVVGGVPLPSAGGLYQARLAAVAPGAPIPGDMAPVIALRKGRPAAAVASVGSSLTPETLRIAAGLLGSADPASLMAAPPMLLDFGASMGKATAVPQGAYPPAFLQALRAAGLTLTEVPAAQVAGQRGTTALVRIAKDGLTTPETPGVFTFGATR